MNTITENTQPPASQDTGKPVRIVAIKNKSLATETFPQNNLVGTFILLELCKRELDSRGLLDQTALGAGPLNNALFAFCVHDIGPALSALDEILVVVSLRGTCTLLYLDDREGQGFFRPHGNDNAEAGSRFTIEQIGEQNANDSKVVAECKSHLEGLTVYLESLVKRNPPPADPDAAA